MEMKEEALKLADAMECRAKIRRNAKDRKSVQENSNDRIADQLEQASQMIRRLVEELDKPELNDGGFPVKNATYWKRQYNLMYAQNDRLKSGIYHANEQIKYLESLAPQTKPLSDDEIIDIWFEIGNAKNLKWQQLNFARAIEERHGIK